MMALEGIRVLDLTRLAPGPFCTMLLGDLGADVIVVEEAPGAGRRFAVGLGEQAQAFNALGRNKRTIGLNLEEAAGRPAARPAIPATITAGFAGGGLYAAFAILAAIIAREKTGRGQYVDMAMSDGVTSLATFLASMYFSSGHVLGRGVELLNGASPGYNVYETADGGWLSIGCLEPWFWQELCQALGCEQFVPHQNNREKFPEMFEFLRSKFREKGRDEWFEELRQRDICVAPVYGMDEVFADPHVPARGGGVEGEHPEVGEVKGG